MLFRSMANLMWAHATLGRAPGEATWEALEQRAGEVARDMKPQEVTNTIWASTLLAALHDMKYLPCYAVLFILACNIRVQDLTNEGLRQMFHVRIMHDLLLADRDIELFHPEWMMTEAREAWVRSVRDGTTVSNSQRALAGIIGELGIRHELERVTEDGYFSMDIYLPDHDVALEFDGPAHYYKDASGQRTTTRTATTELRDMLLSKKCAKVVTVPYFEWQGLTTQEMRMSYVRQKLPCSRAELKNNATDVP